VQLKDRVGQLHTLTADVGCRNTLFNGRAQTGARYFRDIQAVGLSRFRLEFLSETHDEALRTIRHYQKLLSGEASLLSTLDHLEATERLGVTEGTLRVKWSQKTEPKGK
jgi:putative protease